MAPIKFEEQIKDKLEQRSIQPSSDAWMQLSNKLNTEENKNSKRLFFYLGIAASIVGVLLVTNFMFKSTTDQSNLPTVVQTQVDDNQVKQSSGTKETLSKSEVVSTAVKENESEDVQIKSPSVIKSSIKNEQKITENIKPPLSSQEDRLIETPSKEELNSMSNKTIANSIINNQASTSELIKPTNSLTFEESKALEVAAEIKKLEIENGSVSDAEIEDLLKQAEKEIVKNKIFDEVTRTVDAEALLQDVEDDLEQSFRTKVFESLKSSYTTVKTAVAERNN